MKYLGLILLTFVVSLFISNKAFAATLTLSSVNNIKVGDKGFIDIDFDSKDDEVVAAAVVIEITGSSLKFGAPVAGNGQDTPIDDFTSINSDANEIEFVVFGTGALNNGRMARIPYEAMSQGNTTLKIVIDDYNASSLTGLDFETNYLENQDQKTYTVAAASVSPTPTPTPPANSNPTISNIGSQTGVVGTPLQVGFTVSDTDGDTVSVTASSGNTVVVPNSGLSVTGTGSSRTLTITASQAGTANITLNATDGKGGTASRTFQLTATAQQSGAPTAPVFSRSAGTYSGSISVTLSSTAGSTIYYCLGSASCSPTTVYTSPITVSSTSTLRSYAALGGLNSTISSATYTISTSNNNDDDDDEDEDDDDDDEDNEDDDNDSSPTPTPVTSGGIGGGNVTGATPTPGVPETGSYRTTTYFTVSFILVLTALALRRKLAN